MKKLHTFALIATLTAIISTIATVATLHEIKAKITGEAAAGSINKIRVAGNVTLILTQNDRPGIFAEDTFNFEKTTIISKGQTLFVNTMESGGFIYIDNEKKAGGQNGLCQISKNTYLII